MDKWKDMTKNGWRPERPGNGLRDQVKGLVGRGEKSEDRSSHVAAPLSSLRDPSTFAPPPKRDPSQPLPAAAPYATQSTPRPAPPTPARSSQQSISPIAQQEEGVAEPAAPPKRWQLDSTGLSTAHLPPPPGRRDGADGRGAASTPTSATPPPYSPAKPRAAGGPPSLPPRLPPRSGNSSPIHTQSPGPLARTSTQTHVDTQSRAENGFLNQGAVNRLGASGISVPGFGIGGKSSPAPPPRASPTSPAPASAQGTTWQQKQAAMRTASQFQKDPSSVSLSDAKSAATTANSFRQRHGEQVSNGLRMANNLGQRFGITEKARVGDSAVSGPGSGSLGQPQQQGPVSVGSLASAIGKKKPPAPPPPKKKAELSSAATTRNNDGAPPPPVPLATRPTF
ncbi:hypothetical protein SUNI508_10454 [Seiridium unicorne]|uniref:GMP synthase n=1 Tax=Seiridium unicorne TaxID=138068 RepID=A0ABR2ULC9_9PEZI